MYLLGQYTDLEHIFPKKAFKILQRVGKGSDKYCQSLQLLARESGPQFMSALNTYLIQRCLEVSDLVPSKNIGWDVLDDSQLQVQEKI